MEGKRKSQNGGRADSSQVDPLPDWVQNFMRRHHGYCPQFAMEKAINMSDLNKQQNRLLIPSHFVESHILPMMDEHEKSANLQPDIPLRTRKMAIEENAKEAEDESARKKKKEEESVMKVCPCRYMTKLGGDSPLFWFVETLIQTVFRGEEWLQFAKWSGFRVEDKIEMWGFRRGDGRLCFLLRKE